MMESQLLQLDSEDRKCATADRVSRPTVRDLQAVPTRWRVLASRADMSPVVGAWSQLANGSTGSLFSTPEWVNAWLETIGQDVQPRILVGEQNNRLLALWPLGLRCDQRGPIRISVLEPMGEILASGDRLDPLLAADELENTFIQQVRKLACAGCDLIHWGELRVDGRLACALGNEHARGSSRTIEHRVLPLADLPATYDEFTARLGKKLRGHVRRQEQIAIQQQGLSWKLNDGGASLDAAIQEFVTLHQQCWSHRGKSGNLAESRFRAFIEEFAHAAHRRGWLRLHRLCSGQRTVAALMAFHHNDRAYYYQSGWNPEIAKLSPGSLCVARAVRCAIEEGFVLFDFLRGDEAYKRRWANRQDQTVTIAEAATLRGRAVLAGRDVKQVAKHGVIALGGNAGWERVKAVLMRQPKVVAPERGD